jgi:hypothetical protein
MTMFKKKPRKTMENMRSGLPVILKKLPIHSYPHPTIRSQGVIVVEICWINRPVIANCVPKLFRPQTDQYCNIIITFCRLHVQQGRCEIQLRVWYVLVHWRRFDV